MTDELYNLYKSNADFAEYVDKWCKSRGLSIFEVFRIKIVQEYATWLVSHRKDVIK